MTFALFAADQAVTLPCAVIPLLILGNWHTGAGSEPAAAIRGRITDAGSRGPDCRSGRDPAAGIRQPGRRARRRERPVPVTNLASGTYRVSAGPPSSARPTCSRPFTTPRVRRTGGPSCCRPVKCNPGRHRAREKPRDQRPRRGRMGTARCRGVRGGQHTVPRRVVHEPQDRRPRDLPRVRPSARSVLVDQSPSGPAPATARAAASLAFAPTCFPSATAERDALRIQVGRTDVDGVEIQIVRGRTFKVSGTVVGAPGAPLARASSDLIEWSEASSGSRGTSLAPDGQFVLDGLLPREYIVTAEFRNRTRCGMRRARDRLVSRSGRKTWRG